MRYQISPPGFEGQQLEVQLPNAAEGAKLLVNGEPAPRGPQRGTMLLRANNGTEHIAKWKLGAFGLDFPALRIGDQTIRVVEPLPWYVWLWGGIPFTLIIFGLFENIVLLSAILSVIAVAINIKIFRSNLSPSLQFLVSIAFTLVVFSFFAAFVGAFIPE